jgi:hypothetical protein
MELGRKFTQDELNRALQAIEALHELACHDVDNQLIEALITHYQEEASKRPGVYHLTHKLRMLVCFLAWRRVGSRSERQMWY